MEESKEKKTIKITLKTAILCFILLLAILVGIYFLTTYLINRKYINYNMINVNENIEIEDEQIAQLINVDINEFKNFKDNFIGANISIETVETNKFFEPSISEKKEFKNLAKNNFILLEKYILNNDVKIAEQLIKALNDTALYVYGEKLSVVEQTEKIDSNLLNSFYTNVCAGLIKNHFKFDEFNIKVTKIEKYNDITMYITVNNKYLVVFEYDESECYFVVYNGTKYDADKEELIFDHIQGYNSFKAWYRIENMPSTDKPVIYLYPEETTKVSVKLGRNDKLTSSYPKYEEKGWDVTAEPSGKLTDINTGRELYCLYWEGKNTNETNMNEGFVIKGEDTIKFLEEKLEILGLNEKEAQEFIIYWLPQMEDNKYNYIRFETIEEINNNMPLEITPVPDNIIRINMQWKAVDEHIKVEEQVLEKAPERTGFTVVEWGGTKLD